MRIAILPGAGLILGKTPGLVTARLGTTALLVLMWLNALILLIAVESACKARPRFGGRGR